MSHSIDLLFVGDVSLNGVFTDPIRQRNLVSSLKNLKKRFDVAECHFCNWEAPVTDNINFNSMKSTILATTQQSAELFLDNWRVDIACLGNNHIGDCRAFGLESTVNLLNGRGIRTLGASFDDDDVSKLLQFEMKGKKFGVLSFVGRETNPKIHPDDLIKINYIDPDNDHKTIARYSEIVDTLIVSLHWGAEFCHYPSASQKEYARKLVDSGASIIYGHHSHCLQGAEKYNNGVIMYSLGNFIFSGLAGRESIGWPKLCSETGGYLVSVLEDSSLSIEFVPLITDNDGVRQVNERDYNKFVEKQSTRSKFIAYEGTYYSFMRKLNLLNNWLIAIPLFLVKSKGGFLPAAKSYLKLKNIKLIFSTLKN